MKTLICALILLIACPVSASTVFLTDGQKRETGKCTITKHSEIIECLPKEVGGRTQSIPLKAIKQIIRADGSVLTRAEIEQFVNSSEGQKAAAKPSISSDETLALLYKETTEYLRELKRDIDKNEMNFTKIGNTAIKCATAFNDREIKGLKLSPSESAAIKYYEKKADEFSETSAKLDKISGQTERSALAAQKSLFARVMSKKVIWDAMIRHEKLDIPIEKIE